MVKLGSSERDRLCTNVYFCTILQQTACIIGAPSPVTARGRRSPVHPNETNLR